MEYKESPDTLFRMVSVSFITLVSIVFYNTIVALSMSHTDLRITLFIVGTLFITLLATLGSYLFAPKSYAVDNVSLTIVRPIGNKIIKLTDISEIRTVATKEMSGALRLYGIYGFWGNTGKYYAFKKIGFVTVYGSHFKNMFLIQTLQKHKLIISQNDTRLFNELQDTLKQ